jgi:phosphoglycolate phosphatase
MHFVFDLDGTISDPAVGIARSLNHALRGFGYPALREEEVPAYIGLPLDDIFRRVAASASDVVLRGLVTTYRQRYGEIGYAENVIYPGVSAALERLASDGVRMGVCTSKRQDFAERILELFDLRAHFTFVCGGDIGVRKDEQLRSLREEGRVSDEAVVIGDRASDVFAARANGLRAVGVLWGHGTPEELACAHPDRLLGSPSELASLAEMIS